MKAKKLSRHEYLLLLGLILSPLANVAPAAAEGACPPGYIPGGAMVPGQENAGWTGCLHAYDADGGDGGAGGIDPGPPPFDREEFRKLGEWERAIARKNEEEALRRDPVLRALKNGVWKFSKSNPGDPRQVCSAVFLKQAAGVMIMDWGGSSGGTSIGYFGGLIPPAQTIRRERVSLVQSGRTQTVVASHASLPWAADIGMILFAVPSTEALLGAMEDEQDFSVRMGGETLLTGKWHGGGAAKKWLSRCVRERR